MMLQRKNLGLLICFVLPLIQVTATSSSDAQATADQSVVVRIQPRYAITFAELEKYVSDHQYDILFRSDRAKAYTRALEELVVRKLKIVDFFNSRLYENKRLVQSIGRTLAEELVIQYYRTHFLAKEVNDSSIREAYNEMGKEVAYRQITMAKRPQGSHQHSRDSLKSLAIRIKAQLDTGADFAALAKQYARDAQSFSSDTSLHVIGWRMSLSDSLLRTVFRLAVGDVRILEDRESLRIMKIARIDTVPVPPFEEAKDEIVRTLEGKYFDRSLQEFERSKKALVDERTLEWNRTALEQLVAWSNTPGFYVNGYLDTLQQALARGRNPWVLRYSRGTVDLREYLRLLVNVLVLRTSASYTQKDIRDFIVEAVRTDMLVRKANKLNLEKEIFNPATTNPVLENEIVRLYEQQMVDAKIPPVTDSTLRKFYDENKDSLYYQLAKINIFAIIDSNKQRVEELKLKLGQNIPFEKLTGEVFVKTFIRDRNGLIKSYLSTEKPFLGEAAFALKPLEVAGPIEYVDPQNGRQYALIKCVARRQEKQLLYQDVGKTIPADFREYHRTRLMQATEEQLRKEYSVVVDRAALRQNLLARGIRAQ